MKRLKARGRYGFKNNIQGYIGTIENVEFPGKFQIPLISYIRIDGMRDKWTATFSNGPWSWLEYDGERYETREDYDRLAVKVEQEKIEKMLEDM